MKCRTNVAKEQMQSTVPQHTKQYLLLGQFLLWARLGLVFRVHWIYYKIHFLDLHYCNDWAKKRSNRRGCWNQKMYRMFVRRQCLATLQHRIHDEIHNSKIRLCNFSTVAITAIFKPNKWYENKWKTNCKTISFYLSFEINFNMEFQT